MFVWIGEESSDVERKLGLKSAQLYSQHVKDMTGNARKLCVMRRGKENLKWVRSYGMRCYMESDPDVTLMQVVLTFAFW